MSFPSTLRVILGLGRRLSPNFSNHCHSPSLRHGPWFSSWAILSSNVLPPYNGHITSCLDGSSFSLSGSLPYFCLLLFALGVSFAPLVLGCLLAGLGLGLCSVSFQLLSVYPLHFPVIVDVLCHSY